MWICDNLILPQDVALPRQPVQTAGACPWQKVVKYLQALYWFCFNYMQNRLCAIYNNSVKNSFCYWSLLFNRVMSSWMLKFPCGSIIITRHPSILSGFLLGLCHLSFLCLHSFVMFAPFQSTPSSFVFITGLHSWAAVLSFTSHLGIEMSAFPLQNK